MEGKDEAVSQARKLEMWRTGKGYRRKESIREAGQSPGCDRGGKIHTRARDQEGRRQKSLLRGTGIEQPLKAGRVQREQFQ